MKCGAATPILFTGRREDGAGLQGTLDPKGHGPETEKGEKPSPWLLTEAHSDPDTPI